MPAQTVAARMTVRSLAPVLSCAMYAPMPGPLIGPVMYPAAMSRMIATDGGEPDAGAR